MFRLYLYELFVWTEIVWNYGWLCTEILAGVYMTPGQLSRRSEFTTVPSHGSTFVYMIPLQHVMPARVTPAWVHPGCCTGARISLRYEISQRYHVKAKRPHVSVWNGSVGRLEREAHALCLRFWITLVFYQHEVYLQIARYEMMKWPSHNVNAIRNQKVIPVWNSRECEFSRANTPLPSDARIQSATIRGLGLTLEKKPALRRLSREVRVFRREDCLLVELG